VKLLLAQGAAINAVDPYGLTPFHKACQYGNYEVVKMFLESGVDLNIPANTDTSYAGATPLMVAAYGGHENVVKLLLLRGANVNRTSAKGAAIFWAFDHDSGNNPELIRLLVSHGANVNNGRNYRGQTPLMAAASKEHIEIVRLLLDLGAEKSLTVNGLTAADWAKIGSEEIYGKGKAGGLWKDIIKLLNK